MTIALIPLIGAAVALVGGISVMALGAMVIMKRTETSSLFVEDKMGFVVAKLTLAAVLIAVGFGFSCSAVGALTNLG